MEYQNITCENFILIHVFALINKAKKKNKCVYGLPTDPVL